MREKKKQDEQRKRKKERPLFVVSTVINKSKLSPKKMAKKSLPKRGASKKANIHVPPSSDSVESHDDHVITKKKQLGVQHPAWIPGANLATPMQTQNFEDAFKNTFSPFKFTGSTLDNNSVAFTFRKEITMSPAEVAMFRGPGEEGESPLDESCDPMRSDTRTNGFTNTDDDDETINGNSHEEEETTEPIKEEIEEEVNIFLPFRKLHTDVIHKFTILCEEWDKKLTKLEIIDEPPPEEGESTIYHIIIIISVVPIQGFAYNSDTYLYLYIQYAFSSICSCASLIFSTAIYSHFCWKMKLTNY